MRRRGLRHASCAALFCLCAQGCAGDRDALREAEAVAVRQHAEYVVREARAEVMALRSELASARLAAARQTAELEDVRRQLAALQQARAEQQRALVTREGELSALRNERDRTMKAAMEARTVQAGVQTRLTDLEAEVASLTARLEAITVRRGKKPQAGPSRSGHPAPGVGNAELTRPAVVMADLGVDGETDRPHADVSVERASHDSGDRPASIRVQPGDSLWRIAREYRTTVADLMASNDLAGDLIRVGQRLIIPPAQ